MRTRDWTGLVAVPTSNEIMSLLKLECMSLFILMRMEKSLMLLFGLPSPLFFLDVPGWKSDCSLFLRRGEEKRNTFKPSYRFLFTN